MSKYKYMIENIENNSDRRVQMEIAHQLKRIADTLQKGDKK